MPNRDVTEEFCVNPEAFMRNNLVMQWIQHNKAELINVGVKQVEGATIDNLPNGKVCYFYMKDTTPSLPAYWCPYSQNSFKSTMLSNDALFAFTPAVTGCSVGLGSGQSGNQMMCHVNSAQIGVDWKGTGQEAARQSQSQDAQVRYRLGHDSALVSPTQYRAVDTSTMATVFAVHGLGQPWMLYALSYRKTGTTRYLHDGVAQYT